MARAGRRIIVATLIIVTGIAVVLAVAQDQDTLQIRSAVAAADPDAIPYVAALVDAGVSRGNSFDVLTNGDEIFPAMLEAIDGATTRISFESYIYESGQIAEQFTRALEAAARRGVQVNLTVDALGSSRMSDDSVNRLKRAGCQFANFHGPRWYQLEDLNYRTHRKILVVDGELGFVGGVGVADHWLGHAQDKNHWRDTQIRMRGPIARQLEAVFYENFIEAGGIVTPRLAEGVPPDAQDGSSLVVKSSPTGGSNDLKRLYLLTLAMARRSIDITSPYFVTDESSMWALRDAVGRGVKVRVLMEGDITDAKAVKYASREAYEELLASGIELYEYQPTMMHTKSMVVDGVWTVFGSANFDNRSLELNDELNVAAASPALAARLEANFERDLHQAKRITLEEWRRRPRLERSREYFWSYFGEVF